MHSFYPFSIHMKAQTCNIASFHASKKAPKQRKKRDKTAKWVYNNIVTIGVELYEQDLFHPKMDLAPKHFETIVHNIARMVADEITSLNKFNLKNEIPLLMDMAMEFKVHKSCGIAKKKQPKKPLSKKK